MAQLYRLGTAYSSLGKLNEGTSALEKARTLAPKETAVLEALADVLSMRGKLREAVTTLLTGLEMEPESATLNSNLGARLLMLGDKAGAEKAWREAVRLRPEAATMRLNLANLLSSTWSFPGGGIQFSGGLAGDHTSQTAHLSMASRLMTQRAWQRARAQYEACPVVEPCTFRSHITIWRPFCLKTGDWVAGRNSRVRTSGCPHPKFRGGPLQPRGRDAASQRRRSKGRTTSPNAIKHDPNHFEAHLRLLRSFAPEMKRRSRATST